MTRWSAITRTRGRRSALAYGSRSTTAAEDNLNRLIHHERGRYSRGFGCFAFVCGSSLDVYPPELTTEEEERTLIRIWLAVWNKGNGSQARLSQ